MVGTSVVVMFRYLCDLCTTNGMRLCCVRGSENLSMRARAYTRDLYKPACILTCGTMNGTHGGEWARAGTGRPVRAGARRQVLAGRYGQASVSRLRQVQTLSVHLKGEG
jgi:hypothetical protein